MTDETNNQQHPQWMPTAGGVLSIVAGSLGLLGSIVWLVFGNAIASHIVNFYSPDVYPHPAPGALIFIIYGIVSLFSAVFDIIAISVVFSLYRKSTGAGLWQGASAPSSPRASWVLWP